MNRLTYDHAAKLDVNYSSGYHPEIARDEWSNEDKNLIMSWLSRLTDIGYRGWKQRGSPDYGC